LASHEDQKSTTSSSFLSGNLPSSTTLGVGIREKIRSFSFSFVANSLVDPEKVPGKENGEIFVSTKVFRRANSSCAIGEKKGFSWEKKIFIFFVGDFFRVD
jgi:hypothetical protein